VQIRFGDSGPFEPGTMRGTYKWNIGGLRLEVVRTQQLTLTVVERESQQPVEAFRVDLRSPGHSQAAYCTSGPGLVHAGGVVVLHRILPCRNLIVVVPADPMLATSRVLTIEGNGSLLPPVRIEVERLRPFKAWVVNDRGVAVAGAVVDVIDTRGGAKDLSLYEDYRTRRLVSGSSAPVTLRHATGTTDGEGMVTLLAPPSCIDLHLVVRRCAARTADHEQVLRSLPDKDEVIRVELPAR
jgi:hypothetical protein